GSDKVSNQAIEIFKKRRSQYALGKNLDMGVEQITQLIQEAVRQAPSSFNSQSSRAVILFGEQSEKFWQLAKDRSEEHTSELQSRENLVCRLLLENKNTACQG